MGSGDARLTEKEYLVLIVRTVLYLSIMAAAVFLCAGRLSYWQGWVFFGVTGLYTVFSFFLPVGVARPRPGADAAGAGGQVVGRRPAFALRHRLHGPDDLFGA